MYCDVICHNAGFYLLEGGIVDCLQEGVLLAKDTILSGYAYKKLVEIVLSSGGRPTWYE